MTRLALAALLCSCAANVTYAPTVELDAGQGGAQAEGCTLQADCEVGDGVHDICYEYKAAPLTACVLGDTLPCDAHWRCAPFGWCDPALGACQAEGASTCLVNGELANCESSGEACCEGGDGVHRCSAECLGTELEP